MELLEVIVSLLLLAASAFGNDALSKTCCDQGRQAGTLGSCAKKDMMNSANVDNMLCKAAWTTCCLMSKQVRSCHTGMTLAMKMGSCKSDSDGKCTYMKELCCNECKVGFSFAAAGKDCESIDIISSAGVSRTCCREMKSNQRLETAFKKAELGVTKRSDGSIPDAGKTGKDGTPKPTQAAPTVAATKAKRPASVKAGETKLVTTAAPIVKTQKPKQTCLNKNCAHQCRDTSVGPMCSCRRGYSLASDGISCQDINECLQPNICGPEGQCVNQVGVYYCRCAPGSEFDSITRRCKSFNPCDRVTCAYQCKNLGKGRYRCLCPEGQVLNNDRRTCRDYSPCENNPCKYQCKVIGLYRYRCVCPPGYQIAKDSVSCEVNKYEVLMTVKNIDKVMKYSLQWMENNQRMRIDIPTDTTVTRTFKYQMATEPNSLAMQLFDAQNRLIPINGKDYYIVRPSLGMTTIELNVGQANRDPCSTNPCDHICTATGATTYRCSCRPGFAFGKDGRCTVLQDPCSSKPCQHQCYNMGGGSYICSCPYGQQLNSDGRTCRVVDACLNSRCQWKCKAEEKRAICLCPSGYILNGSKCVDIDECKVGRSNCGNGTSCFNTLGSYKCVPSDCPGKYFRKYRERYCYKQCPFGDDKCYKDKVYVHQWLMSAVRNNLPPNYVSYYYSVYRPSFPHNIRFEIRSGNEDASFYLIRDSEYKVTIKNRKKLVGPNDYKLELVVSIYKNGQLNSQIITNFYVYVSKYQF